MNNVAEHSIPGPLRSAPRATRRAKNPHVHCRDKRWPAVAAALASLRADRRRSVRIVDADCGTGTLLLCAVRHARALGFTAIEARGIDDAPTLVGFAQSAAAAVHDPAIGITFETADLAGDLAGALDSEADFPADIVVWHGCRACDAALARAVAAAGRTLISDPADARRGAA